MPMTDPASPKGPVHYADSTTRGRPLCGAKMEEDLSNVRMNQDHVTCPKCLGTLLQNAPVVSEPKAQPDPKINQILKERREMLSRVRADLDKVGQLQAEFQQQQATRKPAGKSEPSGQ